MKRKKVLLLGGSGQLGAALTRLLDTDYDLLSVGKSRCNFLDQHLYSNLESMGENWDFIINCVAFTHVENAEHSVEQAMTINGQALTSLCRLAESCNSMLIHFSTDYVFDGTQNVPYGEDSSTNPINIYGQSKLMGEHIVENHGRSFLIFRTSWLYSSSPTSFFGKIAQRAREKKPIEVVDDQIGSPTYVEDLALAVYKVLPQTNREERGIFHYSSHGVASWYDFAQSIVSSLAPNSSVKPVRTHVFASKAKRPHYSVLDKTKIETRFLLKIPHWREGLERMTSINRI